MWRSDDVERAVNKLNALGNGFKIIQTGNETMVQSVPLELGVDQTKALGACNEKGFITRSELQHTMGWDRQRVEATLQFLLTNEFAWVDRQAREETFWIMGMVNGAATQT